jgi:hypothetical protein
VLLVYLDEDVDVLLTRLLAGHGHDCTTAVAAGNLGLVDEQQLESAAQDGRILITHNVTDFQALAVDWWNQQKTHAGIILTLRRTTIHAVARHVLSVLSLYDQPGWRNVVLFA